MKRIIIALLLLLGLGRGCLRAQLVVADPTQTATTAAGFAESVGQALEQTGNLLSLLNVSETQLEKLNKGIELVEKVSLAARTVQYVVDGLNEMYGIVNRVNSSIKTLKTAVSQKHIGIQEATNILDAYSGVLNSLTSIGNGIKSVTTNGLEQMEQWQRNKVLGDLLDSIHFQRDKVENLCNGIDRRLEWRSTLKAKQDSLNALSALAAEAKSNEADYMSVENLESGAPIVVPPALMFNAIDEALEQMAASKSDKAGGTGSKGGWGVNPGTSVKTSTDAKNAISREATGWRGLFWTISGLIGLLGAFNVYRKYQFGGEDLTKSIATWGGTTLLLFILGLMF